MEKGPDRLFVVRLPLAHSSLWPGDLSESCASFQQCSLALLVASFLSALPGLNSVLRGIPPQHLLFMKCNLKCKAHTGVCVSLHSEPVTFGLYDDQLSF